MKQFFSILILVSLCSMLPAYAMQSPDEALAQVFLQGMIGTMLTEMKKNPQWKPDYSIMTSDELKKEEEQIKTFLDAVQRHPSPVFNPAIQVAQNNLNEIQQVRYAKMSFIQRHSKLLILGGAGLIACLCYFAYKHFSEKAKENNQQNQPLLNENISAKVA